MRQAPLDWLFGLAQFGIKFGLDNIHAVLAELDHPERQYRSIHVAGTNGKGSVTAIVETALRQAGHRTGRYTSPHLQDLSERFAVDGTPVDHARMLDAVVRVQDAVARLQTRGVLEVHPTFFEVTTAVAFVLFADADVDVAVCEVGLGGRLDATNVLSPVASAITSIGFDHQQYLGHTLAEIAVEKAGIIKPGVPVVVGRMGAEARAVIATRASELGAPLVDADAGVVFGDAAPIGEPSRDFTLHTSARDYGAVHLALDGVHQRHNAAVAVALLETVDGLGLRVDADAVRAGLRHVQWPGRLQTLHIGAREALLDAAHNADGAEALARYLSSLGTPRPLVFAAMRDKDATEMLARILPQVSRLVVTRATNPRSAEPSDLAALARRVAPALHVDIAEPIGAALELAWQAGPRIVVAGSIFLLADVMKELGRS